MMAHALFSNQREANAQSTVALVEAVIAELGYPSSPVSEPGALQGWQLTKGSAIANVTLVDRAEFTHLRVCAIVMTLDAKVDRAALHAHLLELNAGLCGTAFATSGDQIILLAERSTLDLDTSEVRDAITRVTETADDHDDVLVARFGGRIGG
jgi:Putative bacterial sensory transduction regulator